MNNSKIAIENVSLELEEGIDISPSLRERLEELATEIEAIENIQASRYWKIVKEKVFDPDFVYLQTRLRNEKDTTEIFRLQGKVSWIEKNLDLTKLALMKRNELARIKEQLKSYERS